MPAIKDRDEPYKTYRSDNIFKELVDRCAFELTNIGKTHVGKAKNKLGYRKFEVDKNGMAYLEWELRNERGFFAIRGVTENVWSSNWPILRLGEFIPGQAGRLPTVGFIDPDFKNKSGVTHKDEFDLFDRIHLHYQKNIDKIDNGVHEKAVEVHVAGMKARVGMPKIHVIEDKTESESSIEVEPFEFDVEDFAQKILAAFKKQRLPMLVNEMTSNMLLNAVVEVWEATELTELSPKEDQSNVTERSNPESSEEKPGDNSY